MESALVGCLGCNSAELVRMPCDPSARNIIVISGSPVVDGVMMPVRGQRYRHMALILSSSRPFQGSFPDAMMQVIAEHLIIIICGVIWGCSALETETVKMGKRYKILDRRNVICGVCQSEILLLGQGRKHSF